MPKSKAQKMVFTIEVDIPASRAEEVARALYFRTWDSDTMREYIRAAKTALDYRNMKINIV